MDDLQQAAVAAEQLLSEMSELRAAEASAQLRCLPITVKPSNMPLGVSDTWHMLPQLLPQLEFEISVLWAVEASAQFRCHHHPDCLAYGKWHMRHITHGICHVAYDSWHMPAWKWPTFV